MSSPWEKHRVHFLLGHIHNIFYKGSGLVSVLDLDTHTYIHSHTSQEIHTVRLMVTHVYVCACIRCVKVCKCFVGISRQQYRQHVKDGSKIDWQCNKCSQQQMPSPHRDVSVFEPQFSSTWLQDLPGNEEPRLTDESAADVSPPASPAANDPTPPPSPATADV